MLGSPRWLAAGACLGLAAVLAVAFYALAFNNFEWDAYMLWGYKARVVSTHPVRQAGYFHNPQYAPLHQSYPLLASFLMAAVNGLSGDLRETSVKLIFPMFYLTFGLLLYAGVRTQLRGVPAMVVWLLGFCSPAVVRWAGSGYVDICLASFHVGVVVGLLYWRRSPSWRAAVIPAIFAASAAFTKNEGLGLYAVYALGAAVLALAPRGRRKQRLASLLPFPIIAGLLILPWLVFRQGLPALDENYLAHLSLATVAGNLGRLGVILPGLARRMFLTWDWNGIWALALMALAFSWYAGKRAEAVFLWTVLLAHLGLYAMVYLIGPTPPTEAIASSSQRLLLHVLPTGVLIVAMQWRCLAAAAYAGRRVQRQAAAVE